MTTISSRRRGAPRKASRTLATGAAAAAAAVGAAGLAVPAASASTSVSLLPANPVLAAIPPAVASWCGLSGITLPALAVKANSQTSVSRGMFGVGGKAGEIFYYGNQADPSGPLCQAEDSLVYGAEVDPSTVSSALIDAAARIGDAIENWSGDGIFSDGVQIPLPTADTPLNSNLSLVSNDMKTAANEIQQVAGTDIFTEYDYYYWDAGLDLYFTSLDEASALYDAAYYHYGFTNAQPLLVYLAAVEENAGGNAIFNSGAVNQAVSDDTTATSLLYAWSLNSGAFWNWYFDW